MKMRITVTIINLWLHQADINGNATEISWLKYEKNPVSGYWLKYQQVKKD